MAVCFHVREGVLHLGDACLFRPPTADASEECLLRALGRLGAESMDSWRAPGGLVAPRRAGTFSMTLLDSVCVLVGRKCRVEVLPDLTGDAATPGIVQTADALRVVVEGSFDALRLCKGDDAPPPPSSCVAAVDEPIVAVGVASAHAFVVHGEDLPPVTPPALEYRLVASRPTLRLRVHVSCDDQRPSGVSFYRNGLLWARDLSVATARAVVALDSGADEPIDRLSDAEADALACELLNTARLPVLLSPALEPLVEELSRRWARLLRPLWRYRSAQEMVDLLRDVGTPRRVARLVDADHLLDQRTTDGRTDLVGQSLLRRMQTGEGARDADWFATTIDRFSVARFQVVPIPPTRFATLFSWGCFDERGDDACDGAVILGESEARTVVVPMGSTPAHLTRALVTLFSCDVPIFDDGREDILCFPIGSNAMFVEGAAGCAPEESLTLYRLCIDAGTKTVMLCVVPGADPVSSSRALSMEAFERLDVPFQTSRTRREDLQKLFSELTQRVGVAQTSVFRSIAREVQCRRVTQEWNMHGFDSGANLSSLGLTLLLAILLGGWYGACVRVALSRTRAAMLSVLTASGSFVLVDPTRTLCNLFGAADYLTSVPTPATAVDLTVGAVVEVRSGKKWLTAIVRRVDSARGQFSIEYLGRPQTRGICGTRSHTWRRVSDESSDHDRLVRGLVDQKRKRSHP